MLSYIKKTQNNQNLANCIIALVLKTLEDKTPKFCKKIKDIGY